MTDPVEAAASEAAADIVDLYDRRAFDWVVDRGAVPTGRDRLWLDRFAATLQPGDAVLDVGCGSGRPMAADLIERGFAVTGVDSSARLVAHATGDVPAGRFLQADMRTLDLGRTFAGVLAWHSLFHLSPEDQRRTVPRLLAHCAPRATVMFTSGPALGSRVGDWRDEPLYHGSLNPEDYDASLLSAGFRVESGIWAEGGQAWLAHRHG